MQIRQKGKKGHRNRDDIKDERVWVPASPPFIPTD